MSASSVAGDISRAPAELAARRVMATRRRRVFRSLLLFAGLTTIMVLLSMANRDKEAQRTCEQRMNFAREMLQHTYETDGGLPHDFPLQPEVGPRREIRERQIRGHYRYRVPVGVPLTEDSVVGIACCNVTHDFFLRADGRYVLVFRARSRRFELEWMNEAQFAKARLTLELMEAPPGAAPGEGGGGAFRPKSPERGPD